MNLFAYKLSMIYKEAGKTGSLLTVDLALRIHEYYWTSITFAKKN